MRIENSPQFKDGIFVNVNHWEEPPVSEWIKTSWDFLVTDNNRKPKIDLPRVEADLDNFHQKNDHSLNVTWLGHSTLLINIDGHRIITDPVFEKSVSIVGPSRFNGDLPFNPDDLGEVDAVLISHDHYDHLNKRSIQMLASKTNRFFVPLGVGNRLKKWNIPDEKITELDWWDEVKIGKTLTLASTPAQHFSGRGINDRNKTLWTSWVVISSNHRLYFSGDSGYFDGFRQIGEKYGPFDITFLECGAYNKKWHFVHMFPEETVQAHVDLKGKILHPIHWGTFDLSLHAWYDPMKRMAEAAKREGIELATPIVGETTVLNDHIPQNHWWDMALAQLMK